eukprot:CAMPEP_0172486894 /NCGR_PEP_ID=MMETSP1066-20121228/15663_1 /TAXON_ID=671091 /ORGANISM="Coscinodiscus wailesii, Strain CCMP2513" /LENGTH=217 /DNA_ID=CAMNT_0013253137 /DNA_START=153 /DNA_END=806 /DNA_ORIENTATION=+
MKISTKIIFTVLLLTSERLYTTTAQEEEEKISEQQQPDESPEIAPEEPDDDDDDDDDDDYDEEEDLETLINEEAQDMFEGLDMNGNGEITRLEMLNALMAEWDEEVWKLVDQDTDDYVDDMGKEMFLSIFGNGQDPDFSWEAMDLDGDGQISKKEAYDNTMRFLEKDMFRGNDANGDGIITLEELTAYVRNEAEVDPKVFRAQKENNDMEFGIGGEL